MSKTQKGFAMYHSIHGFALVLVVVILGIIAIAGILLLKQSEILPPSTLTPTPSADEILRDWKTYTNLKEGFSFKYPSDFELDSFPESLQYDNRVIVRKEDKPQELPSGPG